MNRPIIPGRVGIEVQSQDGPNVTPHQITLQGSGSMQLLSIGGLTKLEHAAVMIASHLAQEKRVDLQDIPVLANQLAEDVLVEARNRARKAAEKRLDEGNGAS